MSQNVHVNLNLNVSLFFKVQILIFLTSPAPSSVGAWCYLPYNPSPHLYPHVHPSPSLTVGHLSVRGMWGLVAPPPEINPLPPKYCRSAYQPTSRVQYVLSKQEGTEF